MQSLLTFKSMIKSGLLFMAALLFFTTPTSAANCPDDATISRTTEFKVLGAALNACTQAGEYQRALAVALHAKKVAASRKSSLDLNSALMYEASALQFMGLYDQALARYNDILHTQSAVYPLTRVAALNNSATILLSMRQFDAAQSMAEQAIAESKAQTDATKKDRATYFSTLAAILNAKNDFAAATNANNDCLALALKDENRLALVYCRQTQAQLLLVKGLFNQALAAADFAIKTAEEKAIVSDIADTHLIKAAALSKLGEKASAITTAQIAINIAHEQNDVDSELPIWQFIEQEHVASHRWQLAHLARKNADELSQKMFNNKIANALSYQRAQHEYDLQLQEIALLKSDNELHLAEASTAKAQRTATLLVAALAITLMGFGFFRWIHKRDLQRAELTNKELEHLHDLKDQFLANTSHELRTPLNGIIGLSDLLVETEAEHLTQQGSGQLRLIRDCGAQLSDMVDSILDFSQIRAGKNKLELQATSLIDIIQFVQPILQPLANKKGLQLHIDVPDSLTAVQADPSRLRQILMNLLGNAIKFTERGFVEFHAQSLQDGRVRISIRDSGIGIPESRLQSIFEPFEQVDGSLRRRHGGVGLGLAIARELVQAHGSDLDVHSTINVGTEFSFVLSPA